jgi:membrane protease YdiL (CAAX protease family)
MDEERAPMSPLAGEAPTADHVLGARRALVITLVYVVVQFIVGVLVGIGTGVYVLASRGRADSAAMTDVLALVMVPTAIAGVAAAGFVALWMTRRTLPGAVHTGVLGPLGWMPSAPSEMAKAAVTGCLLSLVYLFVLVPISPPAGGQLWGPLAAPILAGGWRRLLWAVFVLLLAPPIEEFVFRGVLLRGLSNALDIRAAAIVVTLAFVVLHACQTLSYWPAWMAITLLASAAVLLRLRTRSLLPSIVVHASYNLILVIAMYARAT